MCWERLGGEKEIVGFWKGEMRVGCEEVCSVRGMCDFGGFKEWV